MDLNKILIFEFFFPLRSKLPTEIKVIGMSSHELSVTILDSPV